MRRATLMLLVCALSSPAFAAGFVYSDNFVVFTPSESLPEVDHEFARSVLHEADAFRAEFANEWFGQRLAKGQGRTIINVDFSDYENRGLTWAKDHPDRKFHKIFLKVSRDDATGGVLRHEIAHTVLATRFPHPNRLPPWLEEGIASRYDDPVVARWRAGEARANPSRLPSLEHLLGMTDIRSYDDSAYTAAVALVDFLLAHGDRETLFKFAQDGHQHGWNAAVRDHYGIGSAADLQREFTAWLNYQ